MIALKSWPLASLCTLLCAAGCGGEVKRAPLHPAPIVAPSKQDEAKREPTAMVCAEMAETSSKDSIAVIEIRGERIPKELCSLLQSTPGKPVDAALVDADVRAIWADGRVDDVVVSAQRGDRTSLIYDVRMLPSVASFEIQGADAAGNVAEGIRFERPTFASQASLSTEAKRVEKELHDAGWTTAKVSYEITKKDEAQAAIVVRVALGPRLMVRRIRIEGPSEARAEELRALLLTRPNQPLDKLALARDVLVIQADGYDRGLVMMSVAEPELVTIEEGKAIEVVLRVSEGEVYRLGNVRFAGDLIEPAKTYEKKLWTSAKGAIFSRKVIAADVEKIRALHESRGKIVEVTPETTVDPKRHTIDVTVRIQARR